MFDNYIIEVHSQPAGIVVREGRGYRFFSAHHVFDALEGQVFATPRQAEKVAVHHANTRRQRLPHTQSINWADWRHRAVA
jgi:hypothetical protein